MSEANGMTEVNGVKVYKYFADGEWRSAENHRLFDVHEPYDRALYARVVRAETLAIREREFVIAHVLIP